MRIAIAQLNPDPDPAVNARQLAVLAGRAAADGARLLLTPEGSTTNFLDDPSATTRTAQTLDGPFVAALLEASERRHIAIVAGMFTADAPTADAPTADAPTADAPTAGTSTAATPGARTPSTTPAATGAPTGGPTGAPTGDAPAGRVYNTLLVADRGELRATYRKIHLYDAFSFTESDTVAPGSEPAPVLDFDGIRVGLGTCYDLRFPELFRVLAAAGAQVLALPAAWVVGPHKEEHYQTLLRARAIENTCYVVTADQIGRHAIGRSGGFDPMGLTLLDLGTADPGYGVVHIDLDRLAQVRTVLPSLANRRLTVDPRPQPA